MKLAIVTSRYPSADAPYNHMFVHTRCKWYKELSLTENVHVFIPSSTSSDYVYDGINISKCSATSIAKKLKNFDAVHVHLLHPSVIPSLDGGKVFSKIFEIQIPLILYIHGIESQKISISRKDDIDFFKPRSLARWIYHDYYVLERFKKILRTALLTPNCRIITPSSWMIDEVFRNTKIDIRAITRVIPNGIDTQLFKFNDSLWSNGRKAMSIRPLIYKGKYAVDLFIEIAKISKYNNSFSLYGRGPDESLIRDKIATGSTPEKIKLYAEFIANHQIPELHKKHSVYIAPTRMDAQGVSMCEAMSSGLPIITFNTCAIPEFLENNVEGYLVNKFNASDAAERIDSLWEDRSAYEKMSLNARRRAETLDIRVISENEIRLTSEAI